MRRSPRWARLCAAAVAACSAPALAASIALEKEPVVLGRTEAVAVTVTTEEAPGTSDRPLRLAVNVGSFGEVSRVGPGTYRAVYVPPVTRFPQVALVAIWRETGPDARIEFLRIPLFGVTKIPVQAAAGAEVRIQVGPAEFGPEVTDKRGRATIVAEVPPGVREATVLVKERRKLAVARRVPVEVPAYNRLTAAVVPHAVSADGKAWARVEVFYDLGGAAVPPGRIKVTPSLGVVSLVAAEQGRYVYRYQPPAGATAQDVRFAMAVEQDAAASAETRVQLGLPPPTTLLVRPPEERLVADGSSKAFVDVLAFDATGLGLPSVPVTLTANGHPVEASSYAGNGLYRFAFVAPRQFPPGGLVQFSATAAREGGAPLSATANYQLKAPSSPRAVSARVSPDPVPADGRTEARLVLDVRDSAGLPVNDAQLAVIVSHGSVGALAPAGEGRYEASFVAPSELPEGDAQVRVVDVASGFEEALRVPLRVDPRRLLLGVRGGVTSSFGDQFSPRVGADVWFPFAVRGTGLAAGLAVQYASAAQTVRDAAGTVSSRSQATYFPVTGRFGVELYAGRRVTAMVGAGLQATYALYETSLLGTRTAAWGFGALGFAQATMAVGPGVGFVELAYGWAPVTKTDVFHLEAGGLALEIGYRFGVL